MNCRIKNVKSKILQEKGDIHSMSIRFKSFLESPPIILSIFTEDDVYFSYYKFLEKLLNQSCKFSKVIIYFKDANLLNNVIQDVKYLFNWHTDNIEFRRSKKHALQHYFNEYKDVSELHAVEQKFVEFISKTPIDFFDGTSEPIQIKITEKNSQPLETYTEGVTPINGISNLEFYSKNTFMSNHIQHKNLNAVYTYWTAPLSPNQLSLWDSLEDELESWQLSLKLIKNKFKKVKLYTDTRGYNLLVNKLNLKFDEVNTDVLNSLKDPITEFWSYGKYLTYKHESEPFLHIDFDVYMFKNISTSTASFPLIASHPEYTDALTYGSFYPVKILLNEFKNLNFVYVPEFLRWYMKNLGTLAYNTGIFGGNNIKAINELGREIDLFITENKHLWKIIIEKYPKVFTHRRLAIFFDQYLLAAFIFYYSIYFAPWHRFGDLNLSTIYSSEFLDISIQKDVGITHLFGDIKTNRFVMDLVKNLNYQ